MRGFRLTDPEACPGPQSCACAGWLAALPARARAAHHQDTPNAPAHLPRGPKRGGFRYEKLEKPSIASGDKAGNQGDPLCGHSSLVSVISLAR